MKVVVSATGFELTPSIKTYAEEKIGSLDRLVGRFESEGEIEARVVLSKTTRHHKHGNVFRIVADLRLPKQILRAEDTDDDVHASIDLVRDRLRQEVEKYRDKFLASRRKGRPEI